MDALWLSLVLGGSLMTGLFVAVVALRRLYVAARPDQWLVHIRDGRLLRAGVGISTWRRPGDAVVRFSSTMQRVRFEVGCLSSDRVAVNVEGFILWSVAASGEGPFLAYRKMGLGDVADLPADMSARNHLLTTAQHRAFRKLITSEVQRHASAFSLTALLAEQDRFVEGLRRRLVPLTDALGLELDQVQLADVRPADANVVTDLAAEQLEAVRDDAARIRLEATERRELREVHSRTRLAQQKTDAEVETQAAEARARLDLERQRAALREEELAFEQKRLALERERRLLELEHERELAQVRQRQDAELQLGAEANLLTLEAERQRRARAATTARLDELREDASARRDAALLLAEAEERKSAAVRHHELQRETVQAVATALGRMPIKDARWVSIGDDSPLTSLLGIVESVTALARRERPE